MNNLLSGLALFGIVLFSPVGQVQFSARDVEIWRSKIQYAQEEKLAVKPMGEVVAALGKRFIGTQYAARTLETEGEERLVIHLSGLDCYTFIESVLALARTVKSNRLTFEAYQEEILSLRYRAGEIKGYPSRLHYFSDWIYEMEKRQIGRDLTKELGGIPYRKKISFMTDHPDRYPPLKKNRRFLEEMRMVENAISARPYHFLPKEELGEIESKLQNGDLIAITTNISGLDITHVGIAVLNPGGRIHLLHASSPGEKVQITPLPLVNYLLANTKQTGVMVFRAGEVN